MDKLRAKLENYSIQSLVLKQITKSYHDPFHYTEAKK